MTKRIYIVMLLALVATGCKKSDSTYEEPADETMISFTVEELSADWTKGLAVSDINTDVSEIMVYAFLTEPGEFTSCYIKNVAATYSNSVWGFSPAYYYPASETLDFLAYTPQAHATSDSENNGLTQSLDFENKKVTFTYSAPIIGRNHPDLMLARPQTECGRDASLETLQFDHALTQLSMSARVTDEAYEGQYKITRFTMHDIATSGTLTYDVTSGMGTWGNLNSYEFITSAMLPDETIMDEDGVYESPVLLTTDYESIMSNGHTLFMIPQAIEGKTLADGVSAPTIQITVYDEVNDLTYRTDKLTLPTPSNAGWIAGQHVNLLFEFTPNSDNLVLSMTLSAVLSEWVPQPVDKEIDTNIYSYLSQDSIEAGTTTLTLYTNGTVTGVSCSGTITSATLGSSDGDGGYPITVTGSTGSGTITVTMDNTNGTTTINKTFNITVN